MPQAGNTMEEGTVISWRVKAGDPIAVGQILCEIETDKATMDFESPDAGRLARIVAPVGEPVAVKELIAILADSDADADAYLAGQGQSPVHSPARYCHHSTCRQWTRRECRRLAPASIAADGRVKASPAAAQVGGRARYRACSDRCRQRPGGRILSTDLANRCNRESLLRCHRGEAAKFAGRSRRCGERSASILQQSKQTVPHFYVRTTIDADPLLAFLSRPEVVDQLHAQRHRSSWPSAGRSASFRPCGARSSATKSSSIRTPTSASRSASTMGSSCRS